MSNELAVAAPQIPWEPNEAKVTRKVIKGALMAGVALGGLYAFNSVAPTMVDATDYLVQILDNTKQAAISGILLVGTVVGGYSLLVPGGKLNRLVSIPFNMAVRATTRALFTIDPMTPIDQRIEAVEKDKANMDAQAEKLSGVISRLQEQEQSFTQQTETEKNRFIAAHKMGGHESAENIASHNAGEFRDTANTLAQLRLKLTPMLTNFQQISEMCDVTIQKLKVQRVTLKAKWDAQKAVNDAVNSANRVLGRSRTEEWARADMAAEIVNENFGESLGHLDHLIRSTTPLLQSIDLDNASFREDLLADMQDTTAKMAASVNATPMPSQPVPLALTAVGAGNFKSFV